MPALRSARVPATLASWVLVTLLAAPAAARVEIAWDPNLALERDRASYQKLLVEIVERAQATVVAELGIPAERALKVQVHSPAGYAERFGAAQAQRAGAHYWKGAIQVNGGRHLAGRFEALMVHEMVHAVLDQHGTAHRLPTWLNEGLAERLEYRQRGSTRLEPGQINELKQALEQKRLLPLVRRGRLSPYQYLQSYAAVEFLLQRAGAARMAGFITLLLDGTELEAAMRSGLGITVSELERDFPRWVQGL